MNITFANSGIGTAGGGVNLGGGTYSNQLNVTTLSAATFSGLTTAADTTVGAVTGATTINLNSGKLVITGSANFSNGAVVNLTNGGTLAADAVQFGSTSTPPALLNIVNGTVNITGNATFSGTAATTYSSGSLNVGSVLTTSNTSAITTSAGTVLRTHGLTMNDTSAINLTGGLIDDYTGTSPLTTITGYVISGRNSGAWNGAGINSSAVAADPTHKAVGIGEASVVLGASGGTFAGQAVDGTAVLVKYTYLGDANLDGKVDIGDLGALATHYGQSSQVWTGGDFNYDGTVNIADLGALATNYGAGATSPLTLNFERALAQVEAQSGVQLPEPALGLYAAASVFAARRRRW